MKAPSRAAPTQRAAGALRCLPFLVQQAGTMRVFTATLATETNTFAPLPTGMATFEQTCLYPAGRHPDRPTLFSAPLWVAREQAAERGWTVLEGLVAFAMPGGITTRAAWDGLREQLLADLRAAMPVDIVLLGLHGAMVADGCDDCEGELLREVRAIVGPQAVVGAELDPHHHLTQAMLEHADLLVSFKHYPHTDSVERARELVALCAAAAQGRIRPTVGVADCGMISVLHTTRSPAREFVERIQALEGHDGVLSISVTHGFPWGDVPDMGTKVFVYTDGNAARAATLARQLADELVAMRDALQPGELTPDAAIDAALALQARPLAQDERAGPVVIADGADNPGGGAPGDSTWMLRRLIERGVPGAAVGPLWDPGAVRTAFAAGVGAQLPMRIGGKVCALSGQPLDAECRVLALVPDLRMSVFGNAQASLGEAALVEADGVLVSLISVRNQAMGLEVFTGFGLDLAALQLVVVKSSQHFHAAYGPIARKVLYSAAPGVVSSDLRQLPYRKASRALWPISAG